MATIRTDRRTHLQVRAQVLFGGADEEKFMAEIVSEFEEAHAEEYLAAVKNLRTARPSKSRDRKLKLLNSPEGQALLKRLEAAAA